MAAIPSGSDPSGFDLGEGGVSGTGISGMKDNTQDNVQALYNAKAKNNLTLKRASNSVFGDMDPSLGLPLAIGAAVVGQILTAVGQPGGGKGGEGIPGVGGLGTWFDDLMNMIGLEGPGSGGEGGGPTAPSKNFKLQDLLGLLGTDTQVTPDQLGALSPKVGKNVLKDPAFDDSQHLQGQGQWCWDGWIGTGAFAGTNSSVRTVRTGLITIYNMVGTSQGVYILQKEPVDKGANGILLEYLRLPQYHHLIDWALEGTDQRHFEWVNVAYPAAQYPMGVSVDAGVRWLKKAIASNPGHFIFVMDSQGCQVGSAVYDELRFGDMKSRRGDFLGAIAMGNLRREKGHNFPGFPEQSPGSSGMCVASPMNGKSNTPYVKGGDPLHPETGNLVDTEDLWWDFAVAGDYYCSTPPPGEVTVIPPAEAIGGNVGDIEGIKADDLRSFYNFVNQEHNGTNVFNILTSLQGPTYKQIQQLGAITSPHNSYFVAKPFEAQGDDRTFTEIGCDYINSFAHLVSAPEVGQRHQLLGQTVRVKGNQLVRAGAKVMWHNVHCEGDAILVCVNCYDDDDELIGTVVAQPATIINPPSSSNWSWEYLVADFVTLEDTTSACIVFDVEPEAMTTGIVWFDEAEFEVGPIVDAALLSNIANIAQIPPDKVGGPQGMANILTAMENLFDGLASAADGTLYSGVQLAELFSKSALVAANSATAYGLGVKNNEILSNPSTQPVGNGLQPTGEVTFALTALPSGATKPFSTVSNGFSTIGFINCAMPAKKGFITFEAKGAGGTGAYVNVYEVNRTTGAFTKKYSSTDIGFQIPNGSWGWVAINIPAVNQIDVVQGELVAIEIVASGMTFDVMGGTWNISNNAATVPQNMDAARTLASTGGATPATLAAGDVTYGSDHVPFICFGIKDLPASYVPENQQNFTTAGLYTYSIPQFVITDYAAGHKDLIDVVGVSGGGSGGLASGNVFNTLAGQGADGGEWGKHTYEYGTDIPDSVTDLTVIVGAPGCPPSGSGGPTTVGYGVTAPVFDALGAGNAQQNVTSLAWTHTGTAGGYAIVAINTTYGTMHVTYDGVQMYPLNVAYPGVGAVQTFGLANIPGGTKNVQVIIPKSADITGQSVSYRNVSCAGQVSKLTGKSAALSQLINCDPNQFICHVFGNTDASLSAFSGGTYRWYGSKTVGGKYNQGILIQDSDTTSTFAATAGSSDEWAGVGIVLNPKLDTVLLAEEGGQSGGPGGAANYNPLNPNTTSVGTGPGNESWKTRTYYGGNDTTALNFPGNLPGGGGAGAKAAGQPGAGGDGAVYFTARQP